ncbi:UPF0587 protein v1g245604 [Geodia barretti]|uniref:UPF0587 protein v1g245604 n=1 Tax=Geodia barretti TaxID=519541 RepID=A0AA35WGT1_GEOBA|nr:UPF0587 protein v1g245604 [Geodia barretti]
MKLRCANCGETTQKWIYATTLELKDVKGGRGKAHLVVKCKLCGRENNLQILEDLIRPYSESEKFQTIVVFECRGLEPVEFDPRGGWTAVGVDSGTKFLDVDLSQKEWSDYDERAQQPVSILDISSRFIKM